MRRHLFQSVIIEGGGLRTALFLCIACFAALGVLIVVSNSLYWSASPLIPGGEHILFDKPMPEPLGKIVWLSLKPALLITLAATGVSLYHVIRRSRPGAAGGGLPQVRIRSPARQEGHIPGVRQCPYRRSNPATLI